MRGVTTSQERTAPPRGNVFSSCDSIQLVCDCLHDISQPCTSFSEHRKPGAGAQVCNAGRFYSGHTVPCLVLSNFVLSNIHCCAGAHAQLLLLRTSACALIDLPRGRGMRRRQ